MSQIVDTEQVFAKIRGILVEVLMLPPSEVVPEATILERLGAESIDLLDLRFRLEKTFGFQVTSQELSGSLGGSVSASEFHRRFTVEALCEYVRRRLEQGVD